MSINYDFTLFGPSAGVSGNRDSFTVRMEKAIVSSGVYFHFHGRNEVGGKASFDLILRDNDLRKFENDFNNILADLHDDDKEKPVYTDDDFNRFRSKVVATGIIENSPKNSREFDYIRGIADANMMFVDMLNSMSSSALLAANNVGRMHDEASNGSSMPRV